MKYLALLLLSGCATMTPAQRAQQLGNAELCYHRHAGYPTQEVADEIKRRNLGCTQQLVNIGAEQVAARDRANRAVLNSIGDSIAEANAARKAKEITCVTTGTITRCN